MASLAGLLVTRRIRLGYISSLADSLEADNIDLELAAFGDGHNILPTSVVTALQADSRKKRRVSATGSRRLKRAELAAAVAARQERTAGVPDQRVIRKPFKPPETAEFGEGSADSQPTPRGAGQPCNPPAGFGEPGRTRRPRSFPGGTASPGRPVARPVATHGRPGTGTGYRATPRGYSRRVNRTTG